MDLEREKGEREVESCTELSNEQRNLNVTETVTNVKIKQGNQSNKNLHTRITFSIDSILGEAEEKRDNRDKPVKNIPSLSLSSSSSSSLLSSCSALLSSISSYTTSSSMFLSKVHTNTSSILTPHAHVSFSQTLSSSSSSTTSSLTTSCSVDVAGGRRSDVSMCQDRREERRGSTVEEDLALEGSEIQGCGESGVQNKYMEELDEEEIRDDISDSLHVEDDEEMIDRHNEEERMYPVVVPECHRLAWLQCTRYKPPKLPRSNKCKDKCKKRKLGRNPRIPFTHHQVSLLEHKFRVTHYLSSVDVAELSTTLNLTENRVKIWFQNRRARERREKEGQSSDKMMTSDYEMSERGEGQSLTQSHRGSVMTSAFSNTYNRTTSGAHPTIEPIHPLRTGSQLVLPFWSSLQANFLSNIAKDFHSQRFLSAPPTPRSLEPWPPQLLHKGLMTSRQAVMTHRAALLPSDVYAKVEGSLVQCSGQAAACLDPHSLSSITRALGSIRR